MLKLDGSTQGDGRLQGSDGGDGAGHDRVTGQTRESSVLVSIWAEALSLADIGMDDDFFELGGNSLLVVTVVSRIREALRVDVSVTDLFEWPTIRELASELEARTGVSTSPREESGSRPAFRVMPEQPRVRSFRQTTWDGIKNGEIGPDSTNGTHVVLRIREPVDVCAMDDAWAAVVARHDVLRASVVESGGRPWLSYDSVHPPTIDKIDLSSVPEDEREREARRLASDLVWRRFDLAEGPLLRGFLISLHASEHVFGFVMHHFISDTLSCRIFFDELVASYERDPASRAMRVERAVPQYRDYLLGIDEWLSAPSGRAELEYWSNHLADAPAILPPPRGSTAPAPLPPPTESIELGLELSVAVEAMAREMRTTAFVVLLAAQKVVLARLSNQEDITVGAVINGREDPVLERMIGYLADRVYYRTHLGGDPTFKEVVGRVRGSVLAASSRAFVRSDILKEHLSRAGRRLVAPVFNFGPASAVGGSAEAPSWHPFAIAPPPFVSGPSAGMRYWMMLHESPLGIRGRVKYNGPVVSGLVEQLRSVLECVVHDRERRALA